MEINKIYHGNCLEVLKTFPDNSIDSIVTDPPYELGFMGKKWDNSGIAYNVEMWSECFRVLKPGGHLMAFSGTRTYHRMASAIEDAGFEVRDMIEWVYGSGFPKSLNIGKKIDQLQGNEREKFIRTDGKGTDSGSGCYNMNSGTDSMKKEFIDTKGTSEWEGWGTALKPAHENICVAHKRLDSRSVLYYIIIRILNNITEVLKCQLQSNVQIVELSSKLNHVEQNEVSSIAVWDVVNNINIQESLSVLMDILQSKEMENLNLNIVSLCLNFLKEIYEQMNISTTEMETSLIIELKTLNSLLSVDTLANIIQAKEINQDGKNVNACYVENYLNAVSWKLNATLTHSAQENVILKESNLKFAPNHEPICVARKPLSEKSVAENCLKWGTDGINIDACRVPCDVKSQPHKLRNSGTLAGGGIPLDVKYDKPNFPKGDYGKSNFRNTERMEDNFPDSRFPANLIHDNSEEVRACFPEQKSGVRSSKHQIGNKEGEMFNHGIYGKYKAKNYDDVPASSGNASRFFKSIIYEPKASKSERNKGCEGLFILNQNTPEYVKNQIYKHLNTSSTEDIL